MDFDDDPTERRGVAPGDPLPPGEWAGFSNADRAEALYVAPKARVAGIFRRNVPPQEVGDLVQETFRRLFSAKGASATFLDAPAAYLAAAARTILKNRKRSGVRSQAHAHHSFEDHEIAGPDPHTPLEDRDMVRHIEDAIAKLDPTTRDVFLMHRFDDVSYPEIGRLKGMDVKAVERHIVKALIAVRNARDPHP